MAYTGLKISGSYLQSIYHCPFIPFFVKRKKQTANLIRRKHASNLTKYVISLKHCNHCILFSFYKEKGVNCVW